MCRNIKPLFNFNPPATEEEIRSAALQYVRKLSGYNKPSQVNEQVFNRCVQEVAVATRSLLNSLATNAHQRDREVEAKRAKARTMARFSAK